jgi:integrase
VATFYAKRGRLYLDFRWQGVRCQETTHRPDTPASRVAVRKWAREIDGEIAGGTFDYRRHFPKGRKLKRFGHQPDPPETVPTFAEYARSWLELRTPWLSRGTAYDRRRIIEAHLVPTWGERLVSAITGDDIERLVSALRQKSGIRGSRLSNRRINLVLQVVRLCLDGVVRRGWSKENPARTLANLREERREPDPFSLNEVTQFLKNGLRTDWERRYFEVAFFTGLRPSEQIGLQWDDVDWSRNLVCVRRGVTRFGPGETKTEGSVREIHMLARVRRALKAQQAASEGRGAWVFPNERGGALNITNLRERVWKPAIKRSGLRERTMYQTRHTFATLALSSGEALDWVSKMLGHRTTQMVIRHYHKYVPNLTRRDGDALARTLDRRLGRRR